MGVKENAVNWMLEIAKDNTHGYSQTVRWGPSYDCSSLVISAFEKAGVPVKSKGAINTRTMFGVFIQNGFENVTSKVNLVTGAGLEYGDVLLNTVNHTAVYIGNNQIVHARSGEGTSDTADNSGNEIRTQPYYNYPWNYILRYTGKDSTPIELVKPVVNIKTNYISIKVRELRVGMSGTDVWMLQKLLEKNFCSVGWLGADGEFGSMTDAAVRKYQTQKGLIADGIVGEKTWASLVE